MKIIFNEINNNVNIFIEKPISLPDLHNSWRFLGEGEFDYLYNNFLYESVSTEKVITLLHEKINIVSKLLVYRDIGYSRRNLHIRIINYPFSKYKTVSIGVLKKIIEKRLEKDSSVEDRFYISVYQKNGNTWLKEYSNSKYTRHINVQEKEEIEFTRFILDKLILQLGLPVMYYQPSAVKMCRSGGSAKSIDMRWICNSICFLEIYLLYLRNGWI